LFLHNLNVGDSQGQKTTHMNSTKATSPLDADCITDLHVFHIEVRNRAGEGAIFVVYLPLSSKTLTREG
jgi:hypothetical protein